ncbi:hypothetical protein BJY00DRAFT_312279 [Aspergillus carlsbadensis]|nr:hypothetical protein BJY00DRAFT_312279 [Aspergillus carlsbadensis]
MHFDLPTLATLLAVAAAAPSKRQDSACATNAVATLSTLTQEVQTLETSVENISAENVFTSTPTVLNAVIANIRTLANGPGLPCDTELSADEQQEICDAASAFVTANMKLVQALGDQKGLLAVTPLSAAVREVGRNLEAAMDSFLLPIVDSTPACGASVQELGQALNEEFIDLLDTYQ